MDLELLRGLFSTPFGKQPPMLMPEPFLHIEPDRMYNPLTDRTLLPGAVGYQKLLALVAGQISVSQLSLGLRAQFLKEGWLVEKRVEAGQRFYLKYVSLEAHTVCNQACYFCPVSVDRRHDHYMPMDLYRRIVMQLAAYRDTLEGVSMINYNEPTTDHRFLDQVRLLKEHGLPPAVNTNATGLTPSRVDAIIAMGGLRYLSVNLSTLDRERYQKDRGHDHLPLVLRNLDYVKDLELAEQMDLAVLGTGDAQHQKDYEEISAYLEGSRFQVRAFEVMDRAGHLKVGLKPVTPHKQLRGCENVGARPLQHLHITPYGRCLLCCEDYYEQYIVGDLTQETVEEVLTGPAIARLRRWTYGLEEAPNDFICRNCIFARTA